MVPSTSRTVFAVARPSLDSEINNNKFTAAGLIIQTPPSREGIFNWMAPPGGLMLTHTAYSATVWLFSSLGIPYNG